MILFDLDGTLIDSNGIWAEVDLEFLARRGKAPTEEYIEVVTHSILPVAAQFTKEHYGLEESEEAIIAEWTDLARDAYRLHAPLKPGALAYLDRCHTAGEPMALFTASVPELARLALERLGLTHYFSTLIFAQELGVQKCLPGSYLLAVDMLGVGPEICTLFEDSPRNCAAATVAGLNVVGVYDRFYADVQDQVMENSSFYITSFEDLL